MLWFISVFMFHIKTIEKLEWVKENIIACIEVCSDYVWFQSRVPFVPSGVYSNDPISSLYVSYALVMFIKFEHKWVWFVAIIVYNI